MEETEWPSFGGLLCKWPEQPGEELAILCCFSPLGGRGLSVWANFHGFPKTFNRELDLKHKSSWA